MGWTKLSQENEPTADEIKALPKYSIVNLIGLPKTEIGIKKLEEIEGKIMRIPYKK